MQFTIFIVFDSFVKLIKLPTKISPKYCDSSYSKFSLFTLPYRPIKFKAQGSHSQKSFRFFKKQLHTRSRQCAQKRLENTLVQGKYITKVSKVFFLKEAKNLCGHIGEDLYFQF